MKTSSLIIFLTVVPFFLIALNIDYTFNQDAQGWTGDFADYPVGEEEFYELTFAHAPLPKPLSTISGDLKQGLYLSGNNHSDDLFMYVKQQIDGLESGIIYALTFNIVIENKIPSGQFGIGGSPGENVYVKVGASTEEPKKQENNGYYLMNVDKGDQATEGTNVYIVGNLANPHVFEENPTFEPMGYMNPSPIFVQSDEEGRVWIFVGTDSGFEGPTEYYLAKINLRVEKF